PTRRAMSADIEACQGLKIRQVGAGQRHFDCSHFADCGTTSIGVPAPGKSAIRLLQGQLLKHVCCDEARLSMPKASQPSTRSHGSHHHVACMGSFKSGCGALGREHLRHWTAVSFTTAGAAARSWLRSMEFLRRGLDLGISSGAVCNAALSACAEGRQWQQALALLEAAERRDADVIAFSACISACAGAQEWQQALVVFERCQPDEVACTACISACAAGLQWQLAFGLFQENAAALAAAQRAHVEQFGLRRPGLANSPGSSCSF
ncbi:unnamed protein product, partial [Effrenium voratum]